MSAIRGPWEVVGNPTEGYRVRNKDTGRHSTATPTHSLALAAQERNRLNAAASEGLNQVRSESK